MPNSEFESFEDGCEFLTVLPDILAVFFDSCLRARKHLKWIFDFSYRDIIRVRLFHNFQVPITSLIHYKIQRSKRLTQCVESGTPRSFGKAIKSQLVFDSASGSSVDVPCLRSTTNPCMLDWTRACNPAESTASCD